MQRLKIRHIFEITIFIYAIHPFLETLSEQTVYKAYFYVQYY